MIDKNAGEGWFGAKVAREVISEFSTRGRQGFKYYLENYRVVNPQIQKGITGFKRGCGGARAKGVYFAEKSNVSGTCLGLVICHYHALMYRRFCYESMAYYDWYRRNH